MCDVQWTNLLNKERAHNLKMKWLHVAEIKTNKVSVYRKRYVNPKILFNRREKEQVICIKMVIMILFAKQETPDLFGINKVMARVDNLKQH